MWWLFNSFFFHSKFNANHYMLIKFSQFYKIQLDGAQFAASIFMPGIYVWFSKIQIIQNMDSVWENHTVNTNKV